MSLEKHVVCRKFVCRLPVPVPKATASPIEMKLTVKVSQYLFSPVKVMPALGLTNYGVFQL